MKKTVLLLSLLIAALSYIHADNTSQMDDRGYWYELVYKNADQTVRISPKIIR